jgi:hypothetical protein
MTIEEKIVPTALTAKASVELEKEVQQELEAETKEKSVAELLDAKKE